MPTQPNKGPRSRRDAELDFEDFLDLRSRTSKKNESKRPPRADQKKTLRDALSDPDILDEYMDEIRR